MHVSHTATGQYWTVVYWTVVYWATVYWPIVPTKLSLPLLSLPVVPVWRRSVRVLPSVSRNKKGGVSPVPPPAEAGQRSRDSDFDWGAPSLFLRLRSHEGHNRAAPRRIFCMHPSLSCRVLRRVRVCAARRNDDGSTL